MYETTQKRRPWKWLAFLCVLAGLCLGGWQLLYHPQTPLPKGWNPVAPFAVADAPGPLSVWKMRRTGETPAACFAALADYADFTPQPDIEMQEGCHIRQRAIFTSLAGVDMPRTDTRCDLMLRTVMWLEHGVKPVAQVHFGQGVQSMQTQGSYNCRRIAGTDQMSLHSQAKALDVRGFTLNDGTQIELADDWNDAGAKSAFLRDILDQSCQWFATTLGPDYNAAHHDHFHLQSQGWGLCR